MKTICGLNCDECMFKDNCAGCSATGGKPFGGECVVAKCCLAGQCDNCCKPFEGGCRMIDETVKEFNALHIEGMEPITTLYALSGSIMNIEYPLPGGGSAKFWDDTCVYLGTQVPHQGTELCYGLAADENYLMVSEYGENGADARIVLFKKRG